MVFFLANQRRHSEFDDIPHRPFLGHCEIVSSVEQSNRALVVLGRRGAGAVPGDEAQDVSLDGHGRPQNLILALLLQAMLQRLLQEHLDRKRRRGGGGGEGGRR